MFSITSYYLRPDHKHRMDEIALVAGVKSRMVCEPMFYESSEAYKKIKKSGLLRLFTTFPMRE